MSAVVERRDIRPPVREGAEARLVRLSPDAKRLAYARSDGDAHGVYVADPETGWSRRLASTDAPVEELRWSPDGEYVAYVVGAELPVGAERTVGWARTSAPGELRRVPGTAFAWSPDKPVLFVADPTRAALVRYNFESGKKRRIADLADDGDIDLPPQIAPSSDGKRIAFSVRHAGEDVCEVWVATRESEGVTTSLVTKIPGSDVHVLLFWSPKGKTLGMEIIHLEQEQSAIIALPRLQGDGEILHTEERLDAPVPPAWSPSGHAIAFFAAQAKGPRWGLERPGSRLDPVGPQRLSLLDCRSRARAVEEPVLETGAAAGRPYFLDDRRLVVDGGPVAQIFTFGDPV